MPYVEVLDLVVLLILGVSVILALAVFWRALRYVVGSARKIAIILNAIAEVAPVLMDIGRQFNEQPGYFKNSVITTQTNAVLAVQLSREAVAKLQAFEGRMDRFEERLSQVEIKVF